VSNHRVTPAPSSAPITVADCLQRWWPGIRRTHRQTVLRVNKAAVKMIEADPPSHKAWIESVRHLRTIGVFSDEVSWSMNVDFALAALPPWLWDDPAFADVQGEVEAELRMEDEAVRRARKARRSRNGRKGAAANQATADPT
jgi:hypothetical protein